MNYEIFLSPIDVWSGPEYWQNVQKAPAVVFFDFNDFYADNIQTRKVKMLLEEKIPNCQIGILKCLESVAANRFCEQMFLFEAKIVVFKGFTGNDLKRIIQYMVTNYHKTFFGSANLRFLKS